VAPDLNSAVRRESAESAPCPLQREPRIATKLSSREELSRRQDAKIDGCNDIWAEEVLHVPRDECVGFRGDSTRERRLLRHLRRYEQERAPRIDECRKFLPDIAFCFFNNLRGNYRHDVTRKTRRDDRSGGSGRRVEAGEDGTRVKNHP